MSATSTTAVEVSGIGKRYALGEREQYRALRDVIARVPQRLAGRDRRATGEPEHTWALRGVDFSVNQGEVLGVIRSSAWR